MGFFLLKTLWLPAGCHFRVYSEFIIKYNHSSRKFSLSSVIAGAFLDVAGRKAAKEGLHSGNSLSRKLADSNAIKKLGKFSAPLQNAAKKGQRELAVTHFILSQDPEYLEKIMSEDKE